MTVEEVNPWGLVSSKLIAPNKAHSYYFVFSRGEITRVEEMFPLFYVRTWAAWCCVLFEASVPRCGVCQGPQTGVGRTQDSCPHKSHLEGSRQLQFKGNCTAASCLHDEVFPAQDSPKSMFTAVAGGPDPQPYPLICSQDPGAWDLRTWGSGCRAPAHGVLGLRPQLSDKSLKPSSPLSSSLEFP